MTRILVTGATGLLGSTIVPFFLQRGHVVLRHSQSQIADINANLTHMSEAAFLVEKTRPDVIINLVAQTNVDACEASPDDAYRLNVLTVKNLVQAIKGVRPECHLIHISTDMLYDGPGPHLEGDLKVGNTYALSKLAGEFVAAQVSSTILRTNFFGRSNCAGRLSYSDWLYDALQAQLPISVFDDVLFSPLSLATLCEMLNLVVTKRPHGVFNLGAHAGMSKADFSYAFAMKLSMSTNNMQRIHVDDMKTLRAKRSKDMRMDCSQFEEVMQVRLPALIDEINMAGVDYEN